MEAEVRILEVEYEDPDKGKLTGARKMTILVDGHELKLRLEYRRIKKTGPSGEVYKSARLTFENKNVRKHPEYKKLRARVKLAVRHWLINQHLSRVKAVVAQLGSSYIGQRMPTNEP